MNDQGHQIYTEEKTMSLNSDEIVQDIRKEFESMLQYVQESKEKTADEVERSLFTQLLGLGAQTHAVVFHTASK